MRDILANVYTEQLYHVVASTLLAPVIHAQILSGQFSPDVLCIYDRMGCY